MSEIVKGTFGTFAQGYEVEMEDIDLEELMAQAESEAKKQGIDVEELDIEDLRQIFLGYYPMLPSESKKRKTRKGIFESMKLHGRATSKNQVRGRISESMKLRNRKINESRINDESDFIDFYDEYFVFPYEKGSDAILDQIWDILAKYEGSDTDEIETLVGKTSDEDLSDILDLVNQYKPGNNESKRRLIKETGEMSKSDIEPGGEHYEWANAIETAVKQIEKDTAGKLKFIEMQPFDVYQGPYAVVKINGKSDEIFDAQYEDILIITGLRYMGDVELLVDAINGDSTAISQAEDNAEQDMDKIIDEAKRKRVAESQKMSKSKANESKLPNRLPLLNESSRRGVFTQKRKRGIKEEFGYPIPLKYAQGKIDSEFRKDAERIDNMARINSIVIDDDFTTADLPGYDISMQTDIGLVRVTVPLVGSEEISMIESAADENESALEDLLYYIKGSLRESRKSMKSMSRKAGHKLNEVTVSAVFNSEEEFNQRIEDGEIKMINRIEDDSEKSKDYNYYKIEDKKGNTVIVGVYKK